MMDATQLKQQEEALRDDIAKLPKEVRKTYYQLEEQRVKDPDTYAVLNWFFAAGLHHFYLGKHLFGACNLVLMLVGLLFIETYGIFLILLVFIVELPQLFRSQNIVHQYNNQVMLDTLNELKSENIDETSNN